VRDAASLASATAEAAAAMGGLDGLVNAAGIFSPIGLYETTPGAFAHVLAVNLTGTFLAIQAAAPHIMKAGGGTVVNIASGVGLLPTGPNSTAYVASKGGVIAMTKAIAMELAPGIRVNVVCPGAVETPMTAGFIRDNAVAARYALRRPGQPDELAAAILFLTSDESSFVTGTTLAVDGGRTYH
jgi:NAD(P)-dependent dehydrogenase (short-subunit alcohol dehydrogenase family)